MTGPNMGKMRQNVNYLFGNEKQVCRNRSTFTEFKSNIKLDLGPDHINKILFQFLLFHGRPQVAISQQNGTRSILQWN